MWVDIWGESIPGRGNSEGQRRGHPSAGGWLGWGGAGWAGPSSRGRGWGLDSKGPPKSLEGSKGVARSPLVFPATFPCRQGTAPPTGGRNPSKSEAFSPGS